MIQFHASSENWVSLQDDTLTREFLYSYQQLVHQDVHVHVVIGILKGTLAKNSFLPHHKLVFVSLISYMYIHISCSFTINNGMTIDHFGIPTIGLGLACNRQSLFLMTFLHMSLHCKLIRIWSRLFYPLVR